MYDLYKCDKNDRSRFILGKNGNKKLFIIGLNPSTANKDSSDTTVAKVEKVAMNNNFDGFVMANLYPWRSTSPKNLPEQEDIELMQQNIKYILELAKKEEEPIFWAAWGGDILSRNYLLEALKILNTEIQKINGKWVQYGTLTKYGHPRHPSRLSYSWNFSDFNIEEYFKLYA